MNLHYWNMYTEQVPPVWTGHFNGDNLIKKEKTPRIFRVVGHQHEYRALRWIYQIAEQNPMHKFAVFSDDLFSFAEVEFPFNVIPVLQVDSRKTYASNIVPYLNICAERYVETPAVSIFCNHTIDVSISVKWLFLSGMSIKRITDNIQINSHKKIPVYVEKFKYLSNLPTPVNIRQIPKQVQFDLSTLQGNQNVPKLTST